MIHRAVCWGDTSLIDKVSNGGALTRCEGTLATRAYEARDDELTVGAAEGRIPRVTLTSVVMSPVDKDSALRTRADLEST